ncbi:hypothetical protein Tco_0154529 [Tanacetum coccineum]
MPRNSILGSEDEHSDLPLAIANIVGTIYTLELKSYTYYEHGTYESFTCWKVVIEEVVEESASSGMVAANAGSKAPVLKGLTKTLSVATPLKPCAERKQKRTWAFYSTMFIPGSVQKRTAQKARKLAALASVGTEVSYNNLGAPSYQCCSCQATMWFEERNNKANRTANPTFSLCCQEARIDHSINVGRGLYTFCINGQNYHRIGPLLLKQGTQPSPIAKAFRMARDWCHSHTSMHVELPLLSERTNARQYNAPTVAEAPAWITNDIVTDSQQEISLWLSDNISYHSNTGTRKTNKGYVTMKEYYAYVIQYRKEQGTTLLRGGRGDTNAVGLGKRIVLPHTFTGGPMYIMQNYQDAIALCHANGNLDLFISSKPKVAKIYEMLANLPWKKSPVIGQK